MRFEDQMGHTVHLSHPPQRIISLVPSQTELLFDLGLDEEIVGLTRFCVHPQDKCAQKTIVGGTKQFNFEQIELLDPDLILGNKEENYREGIERLQERYPVWMSDVLNLDDACAMIQTVGTIVRRVENAQRLVAKIRAEMTALPQWSPLRVAYFIWRRPFRVVGHKTFAQEMLHYCGFVNAFGHLPRYPEVTAPQIHAANPEMLLLASEPFPFSEKHVPQFSEEFPDVPAVPVDGSMFTWYGSRLRQAPAYFRDLRAKLRVLLSPKRFPYRSGSAAEESPGEP
jgi:ABC-type Fe3+-hydroxamate transport system substrate-binding protein